MSPLTEGMCHTGYLGEERHVFSRLHSFDWFPCIRQIGEMDNVSVCSSTSRAPVAEVLWNL